MITVDELFERNAIKTDLDALYLSRSMGNIPRCHTLNLSRRHSLSEHTLNCLFLVDYIIHNKLYRLKSTTLWVMEDVRLQAKDWLLYHDLEETVIGDIPFYVARIPEIKEMADKIKSRLCRSFGHENTVHPLSLEIAKMVDMIDFMLNMKSEIKAHPTDRLNACYQNSLEVLESLNNNSNLVEVFYQELLSSKE